MCVQVMSYDYDTKLCVIQTNKHECHMNTLTNMLLPQNTLELPIVDHLPGHPRILWKRLASLHYRAVRAALSNIPRAWANENSRWSEVVFWLRASIDDHQLTVCWLCCHSSQIGCRSSTSSSILDLRVEWCWCW